MRNLLNMLLLLEVEVVVRIVPVEGEPEVIDHRLKASPLVVQLQRYFHSYLGLKLSRLLSVLVELGGLAVAMGQRVLILFLVFAHLRVGVLGQALVRLPMGALGVPEVAVMLFKLVEQELQSKVLTAETARKRPHTMGQVGAAEHRKLVLMV